MRMIKFRSWTGGKKKLMQYFRLRDIETTKQFAYSPQKETCIDCDDDSHSHLMQFIGIQDKKATDIYEKDHLRCTHPDDEFIHGGWVEYDPELCCYVLNRGNNLVEIKISEFDSYEIVGNRYQNPELNGNS